MEPTTAITLIIVIISGIAFFGFCYLKVVDAVFESNKQLLLIMFKEQQTQYLLVRLKLERDIRILEGVLLNSTN